MIGQYLLNTNESATIFISQIFSELNKALVERRGGIGLKLVEVPLATDVLLCRLYHCDSGLLALL